MGALQYDSRDAVLGGLQRDYNLADFPFQLNDMPVKMSVQPVVNIKDSVTLSKTISDNVTIPAGSGNYTAYFHITDDIGKKYKNWLFKTTIAVFNTTSGDAIIAGYGMYNRGIHIFGDISDNPTRLFVKSNQNLEYNTGDNEQSGNYAMFFTGSRTVESIVKVLLQIEMRPFRGTTMPMQG